jgi:hypothetical protein
VGLTGAAVGELDPSRWRVVSWPALVGSVALLVTGFAVSGALWGRMVQDLGGPAMGAGAAIRIYMLANLGRYVPGKVWQLVGLAVLAREQSVAPGVAAGAAILGQITALAGASLVGAVAFMAAPNPGTATIAAAWTVGVLLAVGVPPVFRRAAALAARVARVDMPETLARDGWFGIRWVLLYGANWLLYGIAFWTLCKAFGLAGGPAENGSAFAAAYVLGYLALFAPAGIGIREGFLVAFLDPIMGTRSLGIAVIARLWTTSVEIGMALALGGRATFFGPREPRV